MMRCLPVDHDVSHDCLKPVLAVGLETFSQGIAGGKLREYAVSDNLPVLCSQTSS